MGRPRKHPPTPPKQPEPSVESKLTDILAQRQSHAMTEKALREASGLSCVSFKEALIRLERKKLVVKWKNEHKVNHLVCTEFANDAYYNEVLVVDALYVALGSPGGTITVKRTIPFVLSPDNDTQTRYYNRYNPNPSVAPAPPNATKVATKPAGSLAKAVLATSPAHRV